ncbi:FAD:protein FMN transferase [Albibacterium profundi]|uniref:FAD:protein FMN transferase n=1 Tax=Albibacterium profundi TaxID=3134906 RepID=A0ABV5CK75_9SPHI
MKRLLISSPIIIICLAFLSFQEARQNNFTIRGRAQGTSYHVSYYHSKEIVSKYQIDSILEQIDYSMSLYVPNSLITQFNKSSKAGKLDAHFSNVLQKAFLISKDTKGIFDITVEPLLDAWGFSAVRRDSLPTKEKIDSLLPFVGMGKLKLEGNRLVKKQAAVQINVNGIAQGYTVDVLADFLKEHGIRNFFIELGGEIRAEGRKPDNSQFMIGIEGPLEKGISKVGIKHRIYLENMAVTTSGGYNQFVREDDKQYIHILNPTTGFPIESDILSITVLAKDAITADGYDNALMAMGMNEALRFLRNRPFIDAYIVYRTSDGIVQDTMTKGFKAIIKN